jgi:hypothetical protein
VPLERQMEGGVHLEDLANNLGFVICHDPNLPGVFQIGWIRFGDRREAVRLSASRETCQRPTLKTAVGLGPDHLEEGVIDERKCTECQSAANSIGRNACCAVDDANAATRQVLEHDPPGRAEIARESA